MDDVIQNEGAHVPFGGGCTLPHAQEDTFVCVVHLVEAIACCREVAEEEEQTERLHAPTAHIHVDAHLLGAVVVLIEVVSAKCHMRFAW